MTIISWFPLRAEDSIPYDELEIELKDGETYSQAFIRFWNQADTGDPVAMRSLAEFFFYGLEVEKNLDRAVNWYSKAAEAGDPVAQRIMGSLYRDGEGVPQSYKKAIEWYEKAIKGGNAKAMRFMGLLYLGEDGVEENYDKAAEWLEKAIAAGDKSSYALLGFLYQAGALGEENTYKAVELYEKGVEAGHAISMTWLGDLYSDGYLVPQSYQKAYELFQRAADLGDPSAQDMLGNMYILGYYVPQDIDTAKIWYNKAALQNNSHAQYQLGLLTEDIEEAISWFEKSAENGNDKALNQLGVIYYFGTDKLGKSYEKALDYFDKAAAAGNMVSYYNLSQMYKAGEGVEQSNDRYMLYLLEAAQGGHAGAQVELGERYFEGDYINRNYEEAAKYFLMAAQQGNSMAQNYLGYMYIMGYGVPKSPSDAFGWYYKSAESGDATGQYNLGLMYRDGNWVEKSKEKAMEWLVKSADQGSQDAVTALEQMGIDYNSQKTPVLHTLLSDASGSTPQLDNAPTIVLQNPLKFTNSQKYKLVALVKSPSKITNYNVSVNGIKERGFAVVDDDGFDFTIEKTLTLEKGMNEIDITVENESGEVTTLTYEMKYEPMTANNSPFQKRLALIIGNSNYEDADSRLKNPVNDAEDITAKLKELNFDVINVNDQTKQGMEMAIAEFGKKSKDYDVALFYYAGHGIASRGVNYLVPVNASLPDESFVAYNCVNSNLVLRVMEEAGCPMKIMVLDACRNNPFARSWHRGLGDANGLAIPTGASGTFILFSTEPQQVAADGRGEDRNSPFAEAFLKTLDIPGLGIFDFYQEVSEYVLNKTNERQKPWQNGNPRGRFYFNPL